MARKGTAALTLRCGHGLGWGWQAHDAGCAVLCRPAVLTKGDGRERPHGAPQREGVRPIYSPDYSHAPVHYNSGPVQLLLLSDTEGCHLEGGGGAGRRGEGH